MERLYRKGRIRKGLVKACDYRGITETVWDFFTLIYRVEGNEIVRKTIDIYSRPYEHEVTDPGLRTPRPLPGALFRGVHRRRSRVNGREARG